MEGTTIERTLPVSSRLQGMQAGEFSEWYRRRWQNAAEIADLIAEKVGENELEPVEGGAIIACVTGTLFGYQEFHGQASPQTLVAALQPSDTLRR